MTIKDIAKECGCAVGTVSRVLNNHPDVSDKTREKVMAVVQKHGFVLNANAKQLKAQERKNIVVIAKGSSSPLLNGLMERLQKKIEPMPYTVDVVILDENDNEAANAIRIYYEQKPVGFVFLGGSPDKYDKEFDKVKVPCVLISNAADSVKSEYLSSISTDNMEAANFAARHLIKNGHKKIGVIGGSMNSEVSRLRYQGFKQAMDDESIGFDFEKSYESSKYSMAGGFDAAENLLKKNPDITAIFTMSDVMAIGACRKLADLGYKVPEQISVTGFDGIDIGSYLTPRLTTIRQLQDEMVEQGIAIFLDAVENHAPPVHKRIPFEFVAGESVKNIN